jgi:hypothetical protein
LSCLCGLRLIETGLQFFDDMLIHQIGVIARNQPLTAADRPVRLARQSCDAGGPAQRYGGPPTPAKGARAVRARFNFARMVRTAQAAVSNRISVGCPRLLVPRGELGRGCGEQSVGLHGSA